MIDDDVAAAGGGLFYSRSRLSHWYGTVDNNFFLYKKSPSKRKLKVFALCFRSLFSSFLLFVEGNRERIDGRQTDE